ncbi:MAG: hypothetical protein WBA28_00855, partial [Microbacteriaceae bacterium]
VEGIGPVSEWMFCTDYFSYVCGATNEFGELLNKHGQVMAPLETLSGNPKFVGEEGKKKEKIISYLIKNGWDEYHGVGYFLRGAQTSLALAKTTWDERYNLQILIWCISDYPTDLSIAQETARKATCDQSIPDSAQLEILSKMPDSPQVMLNLIGGKLDLAVGETVTFHLQTNIYQQGISFSTAGPAGSLYIAPGASLAGTTLTVSGSDPAVLTDIEISFTAAAAGTFEMGVGFTPASESYLQWNQSPTLDTVTGKGCQVFSVFQQHQLKEFSDTAQASFLRSITPPKPPVRVETGALGK